MRSRINSTDRQKIDPGMAAFTVSTDADGTTAFEAIIDLSPLELPQDGEVVVEAYRQSLHERFPFGTIALTAAREPTTLRELGDDVKFRVKVVEPKTGRLLARGDRLGASKSIDAGRRELLQVVVKELGQEPWKTEIYEDGKPALILNDHIPDALSRIKTDPQFQALILPGALRQVLLMLWVEKHEVDEEDPDHWVTSWVQYAEHISKKDKPDWSETTEVRNWIDDVCQAFSNHFGVMNKLAVEA